MKLAEITFSPTGGTQRVADIVAGEFEGTLCRVDLTDAKADLGEVALTAEDIAVIAVPSYGGRVPATAAERIGKISGNRARCVIICVYGNRAYEDTLVELKDIAAESGFKVVAAISAVAEHSIMHQYAAGRPDDKDGAELREFAAEIMQKIRAGADGEDIVLPGNRPYKKAGAAGMVPKANGSCTNCGLCAEKCPVQAISRENCKITDKTKCISCMRCVAVCPQAARGVSKVMVSVASLALKKACSVRKNNELFIG